VKGTHRKLREMFEEMLQVNVNIYKKGDYLVEVGVNRIIILK
jgi:hypothetical protein